jgi:hypothetical protein
VSFLASGPRWAPVTVLVVLVTALVGGCSGADGAGARDDPAVRGEPVVREERAGEQPVPDAALAVTPSDVLHWWDDRRAAAYARADLGALRRLYVAGAGSRDLALLRSYRARGLRVEGLTTQLLRVEVLEERPGRLRLRVTDRLAGAVAVDGAGVRTRLPRDTATTHTVELRRARAGEWRVARVTRVSPRAPRPAAP